MSQKEFYKIFKPQLSPQKMLELGVLWSVFQMEVYKEFPKSWFVKAKISKVFDVNLNFLKLSQACPERVD